MNTLDILQTARARISVRRRWAQGAFARTADGIPVSPKAQLAHCWCAAGAIRCCAPTKDAASDAILVLALALPGDPRTLAEFNDTHSHAEVLALYDAAIARLESEAAQ